ncbi:hypothetical protein KY340_01300 [Candidatus Woesearchaeota archaeon]|nr:hypothetical protein [Candidatus Woesearchaeota archaeon]
MNSTANPTEAFYEGRAIARDMWETANFLDEIEDLKADLLSGEPQVESDLERIERFAGMPSLERLAGRILGFIGFRNSAATEGESLTAEDVAGAGVLVRRVAGETQKVFIDYEGHRLFSMTNLSADLDKLGIPYSHYKTYFSFKLRDVVPRILFDEALNKPVSYYDF